MLTLTLSNMLVNVLSTLFILTCIFLVLVILIQKPKGGGLSGAFGGAGGGGAVFGAKAGDALTWFTVGAFTCFLLLAIALVYATRDDESGATVEDQQVIEMEQSEEPTTPPTTTGEDEGLEIDLENSEIPTQLPDQPEEQGEAPTTPDAPVNEQTSPDEAESDTPPAPTEQP
ncbi:MAG: preprotein translocase subunit SecG [Phycisphaeraceae bacterium]